ncbi:hypothetical protein L1049_009527 [Liquidambar formosana]|uniref:Toprim domain-containing protein n=1 Tax=Liquidambar formosana TaxID=63359 RepID=A0AAP0N5W0_LIQFO
MPVERNGHPKPQEMRPLPTPLSSHFTNKIFTASSKHCLNCKTPPCNCGISCTKTTITRIRHISSWSRLRHFRAYPILFSPSPPKPISQIPPISLRNSGFRSISHVRVPTSPVNVEQLEEETIDLANLRVLEQKIAKLGINWDDSCKPGQYTHLLCPKCKGGQSMERSLSLHINLDRDFAMWRCFRGTCGWAGQAFAGHGATYDRVKQISKSKSSGQMTEEGLGLEPLGRKLISYFSGRMISEETLRRNAVMQVSGDQNIMAFTYRQSGVIVGCKYRTIEKRFWQEKGTEKALYGLDDIKEASEIIIVEGEIDKLSMEEAGFRNCVSVPAGAPQKVSPKELPSMEKDTAYQYVWNCKEYFDKASRIILATDGDVPGEALAEELARRLGRERCWRVSWPKKDEFGYCKDANEVVKNLGTGSLKEVIENVELCRVDGPN